MSTIEEKATEYTNELFGTDFIGEEWDREARQDVKRDFFAGAKAQKEIDEDNLYERFEKKFNGQKQDLIDEACKWLHIYFVCKQQTMSVTEAMFFLQKFRKAMEEK